MSLLLPEGVTNIHDIPYTHWNAIRFGYRFLAFEELPLDERPAKNIWLDPKRLDEHFKKVKAKREAEMRGETPIEDEPISGPSEKNTTAEFMGLPPDFFKSKG